MKNNELLEKQRRNFAARENVAALSGTYFLLAAVPLIFSLLSAPLSAIPVSSAVVSFMLAGFLLFAPLFGGLKKSMRSKNLSLKNILLTLANCAVVGLCGLGVLLAIGTVVNVFVMLTYVGFSLFSGLLCGMLLKLQKTTAAMLLLTFLPFVHLTGTFAAFSFLIGEGKASATFILPIIVGILQAAMGLFYLAEYRNTKAKKQKSADKPSAGTNQPTPDGGADNKIEIPENKEENPTDTEQPDKTVKPTFLPTHPLWMILCILEGM
jgi:hypothetical protein